MTDGYNKEFDQNKMIAEFLLRITALENLLIAKEIISEDELKEYFQLLAIKINSIISSIPDDELPLYGSPKILPAANQEDEFKDFIKSFNINTSKVSKDN